nr:MAG TPA: hypothetical protein [Caudoviricetes sp.]
METGVDAGGEPFVIGQNNGGDGVRGDVVIGFEDVHDLFV